MVPLRSLPDALYVGRARSHAGILGLEKKWAPGRGLQRSWGGGGSWRPDPDVHEGKSMMALGGSSAGDDLVMGGDQVVLLSVGDGGGL